MKGLKEFIEDLAKDNKLREKFKDLRDVKEIVKLAKKEGYEFTEDEYMDKQLENVSGGGVFMLNGMIIKTSKDKNSNAFKFLQQNEDIVNLVTITVDKYGNESMECTPATEEVLRNFFEN